MNTTIPKGTRVIIRTTNGGESIVTLAHEYVPTYAVTVDRDDGSYFTVMPCRLKSITPVAA